MATSARLPIVASRVGACVRTILFRGLDLTGCTLELQARLTPDTPGVPLLDLTVQNAGLEGLSIGAVTVTNGVPTTPVVVRIEEATMKNPAKVPYMGELGDPGVMAYDIVGYGGALGGDKRLLVYGDLIALASVNGADNAPDGRVPSFARVEAWGGTNTATIALDNGGTAQVSIDGVDVLGTYLADAHAARDQALAAAQAAQAAANTLVKLTTTLTTDAAPGYLFEFFDSLRRRIAAIDRFNTFIIGNVRPIGAYLVGKLGRKITDNADPGSLARVTDSTRGTWFDVRRDRTKVPRLEAREVTTRTLNGASIGSYATLFGTSSMDLATMAPIQIIPANGQSLSLGAGSSNGLGTATSSGPSIVLTTDQPYGNLMYKGGVRYTDGLDLTALVPHIEQLPPSGDKGAGETILGGFQAMLMQLIAKVGLTPAKHGLRTVSFAPGQGETAIVAFRQGGPLLARFQQMVQSVAPLVSGKAVECLCQLWLQSESDGGNANYPNDLIGLAGEVDAMVRGATGQSRPCVTLSYQVDRGDGAYWFSTAARLSPLVQIAAPIYWVPINGYANGSVQYDNVHRSAAGYRMLGAAFAVAWFCQNVLRRPWRPLQLARDARGRVKAAVSGSDVTLTYDVPWNGSLVLDDGTWPRLQRGFYLFDANGVEKMLAGVQVVGRNKIKLLGANLVAGDTLRVGYKSPTDHTAQSLAVNLRDDQGSTITFDDAGGLPIHNWAIGEEHTFTAQELAA